MPSALLFITPADLFLIATHHSHSHSQTHHSLIHHQARPSNQRNDGRILSQRSTHARSRIIHHTSRSIPQSPERTHASTYLDAASTAEAHYSNAFSKTIHIVGPLLVCQESGAARTATP